MGAILFCYLHLSGIILYCYNLLCLLLLLLCCYVSSRVDEALPATVCGLHFMFMRCRHVGISSVLWLTYYVQCYVYVCFIFFSSKSIGCIMIQNIILVHGQSSRKYFAKDFFILFFYLSRELVIYFFCHLSYLLFTNYFKLPLM